MHFYTAKMIV